MVLWKESEVQIKTKFDGVVRPLPRGDNCKNNNSKNQIKKIEFVQTKIFFISVKEIVLMWKTKSLCFKRIGSKVSNHILNDECNNIVSWRHIVKNDKKHIVRKVTRGTVPSSGSCPTGAGG